MKKTIFTILLSISFMFGASMVSAKTCTGDIWWNVISCSEVADYMYGHGGNDTLYGHGGDDIMYGGSQDDNLHGHGGDDTMFGDTGWFDFCFGGPGDDTTYTCEFVDGTVEHYSGPCK